MINFLTAADVFQLHHDALPAASVLDFDKLDSAVHRPMQHELYVTNATIHDLAAVLCEGLCQAHAFEDGNKRTALLATIVFYAINAHDFMAPDDPLVQVIVDLTTHATDAADAASMFAQWANPLP